MSLEQLLPQLETKVILAPENGVSQVNVGQTYHIVLQKGQDDRRIRTVYHVVLQKGQDGWIIAKCLEFPGAISQGKTVEEAQRNIIEAISLLLEDIHEGETQEFSIMCSII